METIKSINEKLYSGLAYDAMRVLGYRAEQFYIDIKPIAGYDTTLVGPAFTTYGEVVSTNVDYEKLDNIRLEMYKKEYFVNNPIVLLQANDDKVAHSGDITSLIYKTLGAKGFITDGIVRDIDKIEELKFPIFAKGSNPIDALDYWALTKFNQEIIIKNVKIKPNDLIVANRDGVIVIFQEILEKFYQTVAPILEKEENARNFIIENSKNEDMSKILTDLVEQAGRW